MPRTTTITVFALLTLFVCASAAAGEIYKCKGAKGETIYQNAPCATGQKILGHGSYAPAPDDPSQVSAAAVEADRIHGQQQAYVPAEQYSTPQRGNTIATPPANNAKAIADYEATRKRWGARMAGAPPAGYEAAHPARHSAMPAAASADTMQAPPPPVYATGCTQGGNSIHCNNSDGSMSYGNVDPFGNGHIQNSDGTSTSTHRDPFGHQKTEDGVCVKDIYGSCQ